MIHIIFFILLIAILVIIYKYKRERDGFDKHITEQFESQHKGPLFFRPYSSHPSELEQVDESSLMNKDTTGIERDMFNEVAGIKYLGNMNMKSMPATYMKVSINEPNKDKILNDNDPNLRGHMNMSSYFE
jgi:hypothetical protein